MHLAMRCFPPKPGEQTRRTMPVDPAESRAAYLAEYRLIKAEAERLAAVAADSAELRAPTRTSRPRTERRCVPATSSSRS